MSTGIRPGLYFQVILVERLLVVRFWRICYIKGGRNKGGRYMNERLSWGKVKGKCKGSHWITIVLCSVGGYGRKSREDNT